MPNRIIIVDAEVTPRRLKASIATSHKESPPRELRPGIISFESPAATSPPTMPLQIEPDADPGWRGQSFSFKSRESVVIPGRTNSGFVIQVSNPEIKTGCLPQMHVHDEIFVRDSLVINNKAYIQIINTLYYEWKF
ncbi:hypothetical protein ALC56_02329 [Trachymyrmex septentrionalis]|uniref:Uncharacterized protein n=1 Tax=Trachymyrmex septentrionalis TaxID=34720 RepID=A0A151K0C8_9HYME|nr:hypothetical protein ALC56_02329 [Trachymyrmex septentrionalis]